MYNATHNIKYYEIAGKNMTETQTRLQEIRDILASLTDEQADLYTMDLQEVTEKLGESPQNMSYEQLLQHFPEGSSNSQMAQLLREKRAEAKNLEKKSDSESQNYALNRDGTVKKF